MFPHLLQLGITSLRNSESHCTMVLTFLATELWRMRQRVRNVWLQQDGAIAHTTRQSMTFLRGMFPCCLISQLGDIPWPPCSLDVTDPEFCLWSYPSQKCMLLAPTPPKNWRTALWQNWNNYCNEFFWTSDSDYNYLSNVMEAIWNM
jgi:hypothetical protein